MDPIPNREARRDMRGDAVKYGVDALLTPEAFTALLDYLDKLEDTNSMHWITEVELKQARARVEELGALLREACVECREHAAVYDSWRLAAVAERIGKLLPANQL